MTVVTNPGDIAIMPEMWREGAWVVAIGTTTQPDEIAVMRGRKIVGLYSWYRRDKTVELRYPNNEPWLWHTTEPIWSHIIHPGCALHDRITVVHTQIALLGSVPVSDLAFLEETLL